MTRTKSIFDFELQGEIVDQDKTKYSVMVYTAPKTSIEEVKTLFSNMGITLAGITTSPFAIQNIFRSKWMSASEEIFASLFIGKDYSRIDVYKKENLVMSRGFKDWQQQQHAGSNYRFFFGKNGQFTQSEK